MKFVVQRVSQASVSVEGHEVAKIGKGLFVLVGIKDNDTQKDAEILVEKLAKLRVMGDNKGKMNLTVSDVGGEMLIVSQFTLYADTTGGNRPSFTKAARPELAKPLYEYFISSLREKQASLINQLKTHGIKVSTGRFGEYMEIEVVLDGPVTIIIESSLVTELLGYQD